MERVFNKVTNRLENGLLNVLNLCEHGIVNVVTNAEIYRNKKMYKNAEKEILKLVGNKECGREGFLFAIRNRNIFNNMGDEEYNFFIELIPYIEKVISDDMKLAEMKIDHVKILTMLKLVNIKKSRKNLSKYDFENSVCKGFTYAGYMTGLDKMNYLYLKEFRIELNLEENEVDKNYYTFCHEIFHALELSTISKDVKSGISYFYNNDKKLTYLNEGNVNRRVNLVMEEMIKDGRNLKSYETTYSNCVETISKIIQEHQKSLLRATYGGTKELNEFIDEYDKNHFVKLNDLEDNLKNYINR